MSLGRMQSVQYVALHYKADDIKTGLDFEISCFPVIGLDDSLGLNEML